jgi:hypothetical protein
MEVAVPSETGSTYLPNCTASQPTILQYEFSSLWQSRIFHIIRLKKRLGSSMRFEVRTEVPMKFWVFWDMTPCSMAETYRRSGGTHYHFLQGKFFFYGNKFLIFRQALDIAYIDRWCYVVWFQRKPLEVSDLYTKFTCEKLCYLLTTCPGHSRRWTSINARCINRCRRRCILQPLSLRIRQSYFG